MSEDLFGDLSAPTGSGHGPTGSGHGGSLSDTTRAGLPLAVRLRPRTIDEIVGQQHLLAAGSPLRRLASGDTAMSVFLWGPPGTGKTTIAYVVSQTTRRRFVELSAVTAGVKEVRAVLDQARRDLNQGVQTVLFVDEVHRFSKTQQDVLLPAVENRLVTLIAATTENPSFSVISPLLSRSLLLTLRPLTDDDISVLIDRALTDDRGIHPAGDTARAFTLDPEARDTLLRMAGGDARRALTYLEESAAGAEATGSELIDTSTVERAVDKAAVRYDRDGDQHYDVISAFIKSIRGSDVQASLHYLARMMEAGEDPRFIARRLVVLASEDIGLADPTALQTAVAAAQAVALIGMPEVRINLAQAVIALALAPKSNAVVLAVDEALADVRAGRIGLVPPHLRDGHYPGAKTYGHGVDYTYAHDEPHGIAAQQYLPDELSGADYYRPVARGAEAAMVDRLRRIEGILRMHSAAEDPPR
ncbi:putative ATPase [Microlunatus panaciterrae]|uniref:ATPase n=1 Tax=Microlunatus panaciterrae TaxID=400768 RepID=A0ABS2REX1_9ACTN|nr:replication-associated recombination protein A [Microlunatus panaciterrae]MBM7797273.1 putative ATPase [Microlunatus panaciterrae]